ncbi:alpha/beta fold hydrolase [Glaciibacter superstes]|uniref:alpha/beta fold hydrolase n=1 Tax=Glaciibacter superstes TaxID=501023 RepID=UPI0003B4363C|nr:alpha/beta hydrolase [Glaciibacter superstes]
MNTSTTRDVQFLSRPEGRIAYTVEGSGALVVAIPGMGDLRSSYREVAKSVVAAGYRVAVMDLRGHGDSDTTFRLHGDVVTGEDLLALVDELGGTAAVLGSSMGAGAAVWAAAERPDAIAGLALYGPFLREPPSTAVTRAFTRLLYRVAFVRPWGAAAWAGFYRSLNKGSRASWLDEHVAAIRSNMREPGRLRSFRHLALQLDHSPVEARLGQVRAPMRAFIGSLDPDFPDQAAESDWISSLGAHSELVPGVGHYPHIQRPDLVVPATIEFLGGLRDTTTTDAWATRA